MNQDSKQILAKNVKNLRLAQKMTKEVLSLSLGFENSYISKLENNRINITLDRIDKIANFFGIETYKLLM